MRVQDLIDALNLTLFSGETSLNREIKGGYVSDLLSDVMGFAKEGEVWVTLQTHKNVAAIASLKELACVIIVKDGKLDADTLRHAEEENIPMLGTKLETFEIVGKIYQLLNAKP